MKASNLWFSLCQKLGLARTEQGGRLYGGDHTIHQPGNIDVELRHGEVVAVWFRCQPLAFRVSHVDGGRAAQMRMMYSTKTVPKLYGVEVEDENK